MFNAGYLLLIFTTLATITAMLAYLPGVRRGKGNPLLRVARPAVYLAAAGLVITAGYLWHLILTHQYQFDYVYRYTSSDMPLRYVISAFWGGQEGTFLLWALYGGLLALFLRWKAKQYEAPVLFFYMGINLFLLFMLLKANPFKILPSVPPDGNGLNPLLQDPWMTIHPPVMFFGFASLGIPAAYAMAALIKEDWDAWVRRAIPWTTFGIMALGTGLVMGGYWAYSILGWGGFWGWDPVENSSLVPWLVAVALLHNQVIQSTRGIFKRSNLFLALLPFVLLTYSTFLTRSGVLADFSVHSFTDLGINQFLAAFMAVFFGGGVGLFLWKVRRLPTDRAQAPFLSREYFMFLGALAFGLFAVFVLLGTSAPILTRIWGPPSNVQPVFYNRMGLPFAILITLLFGTAPYLVWKGGSGTRNLRRLLIPAAAALVGGALMFVFGVRHPGYLAMATGGLYAALANGWIVVEIMRKKWTAAGGYLAHVGVGLAIVGILTSTAYNQKSTVVLPKGEEVVALGYGFKYIGTREVEAGRKNAYDVTLRTSNGPFIMSPTMFFSDFNAGMMKKPAIQSFLIRDVYISPIAHAVDPLEERVETKLILNQGESASSMGMTFKLAGLESASGQAEGHNHPVNKMVAPIEVAFNGKTETIRPTLEMMNDGHTEVEPATVTSTGYGVVLLAVDATGTHAQIGLSRPPASLNRGQTAWMGDAKVTLEGYDVDMGTRQGGSVKVYAQTTVEMGGDTYTLRPGIISRPGTEELETIEAPIGRTGDNLVLTHVDAGSGTGTFQITPTPQEYLYAEVSLKPFIGLLWVGTILTVLGLAMATLHRSRIAGRMQAAGTEDKKATAGKNGKRAAA